MKLLLDNNVHRGFGLLLYPHDVKHVQEFGWEGLKNGQLLRNAEASGFDVFITADKQLQYQQNLTERRLALIILDSLFITYRDIAPLAPLVLDNLRTIKPGAILKVGP